MRILVAEDERDLNMLICRKLRSQGYSVDSCLDGQEALDALSAADYDGAVLDIMMPGADGFEVLSFLRSRGKMTPVLFLTARDSVSDRVKAGDLTLDTASHKVARGRKEISLTPREYKLLEYLMRNKGIVLSREKIENHIWDFDYEGGTNVVDVYIRYLRKKLDTDPGKKLIHTVRGSGYVLRED